MNYWSNIGLMSIIDHFITIDILTNYNYRLLLAADSAFKESLKVRYSKYQVLGLT
jgi:hypothetical protein